MRTTTAKSPSGVLFPSFVELMDFFNSPAASELLPPTHPDGPRRYVGVTGHHSSNPSLSTPSKFPPVSKTVQFRGYRDFLGSGSGQG